MSRRSMGVAAASVGMGGFCNSKKPLASHARLLFFLPVDRFLCNVRLFGMNRGSLGFWRRSVHFFLLRLFKLSVVDVRGCFGPLRPPVAGPELPNRTLPTEMMTMDAGYWLLLASDMRIVICVMLKMSCLFQSFEVLTLTMHEPIGSSTRHVLHALTCRRCVHVASHAASQVHTGWLHTLAFVEQSMPT